MNNIATAELGFSAAKREISRRGATDVESHKEGNKRYITYTGLDGKHYKVTTRSKTKNDWQTSIEYGEPCEEKLREREFWLFVDLEFDPPKFYPVPQWWIKYDIYEAFQALLKKYGGHRARNENSTHHAVRLTRIIRWESRWSEMSL